MHDDTFVQSSSTQVSSTQVKVTKQQYIKALGPGLLTAAAAIGGSHLVASTQAGALFGWQLVGLILLVNFLKYPFFQIGVRYTMLTNRSLIDGYGQQGQVYLWIFAVVNLFAAIVNTAAVAMLCGSILSLFLGHIDFWGSVTILAMLILSISFFFLLTGHYKRLDSFNKWVIVFLTVATIGAVLLAFNHGGVAAPDFVSPSPWQWSSLGFLVVLMGWMPAPIEISAWSSAWLLNKRKELKEELTYKSALFDFNVGYVVTALLSIAFLGLGALILHGNGEKLATGGAQFSAQLIQMYTSVMGDWSKWLIALVAFLTMFSTTLTVLDGYSRTLADVWNKLSRRVSHEPSLAEVDSSQNSTKNLYFIMLLLAVVAGVLLSQFKGALLPMIESAMIFAFITTPIFAWLNLRLVSDPLIPDEYRLTPFMRGLSYVGLSFLIGFLALFAYWYFLLK